MKIKKGDKVIVISGGDKGKTGTVQKVYPKLNKVVVEGINVHKKNRKPTQATPEGSVVEIYVPIDASNVAVVDPKTKKATRVGYKVETDKKGNKTKVRVTKKSGSKI
jgi:large subunit ribosomal protein L24